MSDFQQDRGPRSAKRSAVRLVSGRVTATVVLAVGLIGCGGGDSGSATRSATSGLPANSSVDTAKFCAAMHAINTSGASPQDLASAFDEADVDAPAEIRADVTAFVANARAVTAAFASADGSSADTAKALATLTPDQRQFLKDLASANQTGTPPAGGTGRVVGFVAANCSEPHALFSSVASSIN